MPGRELWPRNPPQTKKHRKRRLPFPNWEGSRLLVLYLFGRKTPEPKGLQVAEQVFLVNARLDQGTEAGNHEVLVLLVGHAEPLVVGL